MSRQARIAFCMLNNAGSSAPPFPRFLTRRSARRLTLSHKGSIHLKQPPVLPQPFRALPVRACQVADRRLPDAGGLHVRSRHFPRGGGTEDDAEFGWQQARYMSVSRGPTLALLAS